jgi:hypothetical protein
MVLTRVIATQDLSDYRNCARAVQLPRPSLRKEQYQIAEAFNYNCSVRCGWPATLCWPVRDTVTRVSHLLVETRHPLIGAEPPLPPPAFRIYVLGPNCYLVVAR